MNLLILFPNQIFKLEVINTILKEKQIKDIILLEHPVFFGTDPKRQINFNKMKLVLHRSCCYFYFDYLSKELNGKIKVGHIKINESPRIKEIINKYQNIYYIDVPDYLIDERMKEIKAKRIDHVFPSFLLSKEMIDEYLENKKTKGYLHKNYYEWARRKFDILMNCNDSSNCTNKKPLGGKYSYDKYNRSGPPEDIEEIPPLPQLKQNDLQYIEKAKKEIEKEFPKNYGNVNLYIPVTFKGSEEWLKDFIENRLENFGKYEDAVLIEEPFLYHSVISPLLNCGLLTPDFVLDKVIEYFDKNYSDDNVELLYSTEGFIRQILGWREWQRILYFKEYETIKNGNYYEHDRALTEKWYNGTTGIDPIDDTIISAYENAYLHHILRLMYMSNFMNLCRIHPHEMYYWFMSFSMDSYDWVMIANVYSMGSSSDGGLTMTKPYITTGNYIVKMSNYDKGDWFKLWGDLYYGFIDKNVEKLEAYPRVSWMMLKNLDKKIENGDIDRIREVCEKFIGEVTKPYSEN